MLEIAGSLFDFWSEIKHLGELTGLSIGALVALAALVYFDPALRGVAIRVAAAVVLGYALSIYWYHVGSADKQLQWNAANAQAEAQAELRDKEAPAVADADSELETLRNAVKADEEQINALRKADAACHPIDGDQLR